MSDYAKGLEGVIANESALSRVEGLDGKLSYLGYDIDDLVEHCCFGEVTYLLLKGRLPNSKELENFQRKLHQNRSLPPQVVDFIKAAPHDASPMDVLRTGVSMLGLFDKRAKIGEPDHDELYEAAISIIARIPVIVAYYHRARMGLELLPVRTDLNEAAHFLYMLNGQEPTEAAVKTLDIAYTMHADHGMNASTFSARVTVATLSDIYSGMTSAIGTLKGPLRGLSCQQEEDHGHWSPCLQGARPTCPAPQENGTRAHRGTWRAKVDQYVQSYCRDHARTQGLER